MTFIEMLHNEGFLLVVLVNFDPVRKEIRLKWYRLRGGRWVPPHLSMKC